LRLTRTFEEFCKVNDKDISNILLKKFRNFLRYRQLEDLKSEIYLRLLQKKYIENYCPFSIEIDPEKETWNIKRSKAKLSTYVFTFIRNYLCAYHGKVKKDDLCISLNDYKDNGYCKEGNNKKIKYKNGHGHDPTASMSFKVEVARILKQLEKTKHKGTIICDTELELSVSKIINKFGTRGCEESKLRDLIYNKKIDPIELYKIEKKGLITSEVTEEGKKIFYVNSSERRSLYNLFNYYLRGYRDKEISEKFSMTVAGVGAMKRTLRKEIVEIKDHFRD